MMERKQGDTRVAHVCTACGEDVLERWVDTNGGYWREDVHEAKDCIRELRRLIAELAGRL